MKDIINHKALNPVEVQKIAGVPLKVVKYSDLIHYKRLEDMFTKSCKCILLLYQTKKTFGHWCCIINQPKKIVFFDPYALEPDDQLQFANIKFRTENNMRLPYLTYLLYNSKKDIDYNDKRFQVLDDNVNSCGHWTGIRMRCHKLDSDEFINIFDGVPNKDLDNIAIIIGNFYIDQ